jgi:uncharacterized membrane protein HdeD (DUF308 family)
MSAANDPASAPFSGSSSLVVRERPSLHREFSHVRSHWWWFLLLGILLVVCGMVAIIVPPIGTLATIDILAVLFLIGGAATIVSAFWAGHWSGALLNVLIGILYLVIGFSITEEPLRSAQILTLFIAIFFTVAGAFRTVAALSIRFPQWGWALLNGVVTLILGVYILRHYSSITALWVPGILIGIEMLLAGWTWIMLGLAIRSIPAEPVK